ncbi:SDR family NAD(P)-dependent oxidoreductase [Flagellimonas pacifica]|uniref:NAD(P)-dependent dehydrogenase, short-chain alcohol dehydrogenase family n=1 Tax=Flagellimonas pacifica TaxID=1247520 RepID=A0A285MX39_9FLAO|nr:glucose 1-dehydrogenase [Allomuricauda parva]SNZ01759.1 NAD(P)-dependent dehydrogenase, short-chain alcohol dehydrogenase family [Allomuricauda parva]
MREERLKNKVAVVTGGSSGIGRAISILFAISGAKVHILDFNEEEGDKVVEEINILGGKAILHVCDVSNALQVNLAVENIVNQDNIIDILVNNAGVSHIGTLTSTTEEDLQRIYDINIKGVFLCSKAVIQNMYDNGGGVILNMASIGATVALADRFAYSMSKGAVLNMTITIAKDYLDKNIRCNSISPGRVHTPFVDDYLKKNYPDQTEEMFEKLSKTQPIGRMGKPEEIAELALFLCDDRGAGFITGTDYPIDGGFIKLNT